jgi:hypothetical protein
LRAKAKRNHTIRELQLTGSRGCDLGMFVDGDLEGAAQFVQQFVGGTVDNQTVATVGLTPSSRPTAVVEAPCEQLSRVICRRNNDYRRTHLAPFLD